MTQTPPLSLVLTSFFQRMSAFEGILRVVLSGAELSAEMTFRGEPERKVLLDFTSRPLQVLVDDNTRSGDIRIAADSEIMHKVFSGQMNVGTAIGQRELLLRGSASNLARFIPLFDFAPMLYREHLADAGINGFARPSGWAPMKEILMNGHNFKGDPIELEKRTRVQEILFKRINASAYAMGYMMGTLRHRLLKNMSLFEALAAMSKGMDAAAPKEKS